MGWIWRLAVRHNHFRTPPDRCAGPLMATLSEPVIAQTELDAVELGIASPARIGFNAQRVTSIQKTFLVLDSTWRTTFLSRTSSMTIQANPPSGVVTRSTCPTPVKQCFSRQGQVPSWFQGGRALLPYFSNVSSLSGPIFHCVL